MYRCTKEGCNFTTSIVKYAAKHEDDYPDHKIEIDL